MDLFRPANGQLIGGRYRLHELIGQGSSSTVYRATDAQSGAQVAVKLLHAMLDAEDDVRDRFRREAEITRTLEHRHIVRVLAHDISDEGVAYLVMELLRGESLSRRIKREGALPLATALTIFEHTAAALHAAHERGIIHRDIKPHNILVVRTRRDPGVLAKVLDFGISKVLGSMSIVTKTQATLGTPGYMAPELAMGQAAQADRRSDVFSLAATLYTMLAGRAPFRAPTLPALIMAVINEEPQPLAELRPGLAPRAIAAIGRAMNKRPDERHDSIQALWDELAPALGAAPGPLEALQHGEWDEEVTADRSWLAGSDSEQRDDDELPTRQREPPVASLDSLSTTGLATRARDPVATREGSSGTRPPPASDGDTLLERETGWPIRRSPATSHRLRVRVGLIAAGVALSVLALAVVIALSGPDPAADRPLHRARGRRARTGSTETRARASRAPAAESASGARSAPPPDAASSAAAATRSANSESTAPRSPRAAGAPASATAAPRATGRSADAHPPIRSRRHRRHSRRRAPRRPARHRAAKRARLQLMSTVDGQALWADVYVDGRKIGQTPLVAGLKPGRHRVSVVRRGFRREQRIVRLRPGQRLRLHVGLHRTGRSR